MPELRSDKKVSEKSSVGLALRARREQLGWLLEDVADALKLRPAVLDALEGEAYDQLPGKAYALGFVKSYATYLGLDAEKLVSMLDRQLLEKADSAKKPSFSPPHPSGDHGASVAVLIGIGLVVVIAAYAGWYHFSGHISVPHMTPPTSSSNADHSVPLTEDTGKPHNTLRPLAAPAHYPEDSSSGQQEECALASRGVVSKQQTDMTPEPSQADGKAGVGGASVLPSQPSQSASQISPHDHDNTSPSPFVTSSASQATTIPNASANEHNSVPDMSDTHTVTVILTQDSWVQIKNAQGKVLQSRIMKKGERWQGRDDEGPYRLTAGNAGGVVVQAGSVISAPLGRAGTVRHNVALEPQDIMNGQYGRSEGAAQNTH